MLLSKRVLGRDGTYISVHPIRANCRVSIMFIIGQGRLPISEETQTIQGCISSILQKKSKWPSSTNYVLAGIHRDDQQLAVTENYQSQPIGGGWGREWKQSLKSQGLYQISYIHHLDARRAVLFYKSGVSVRVPVRDSNEHFQANHTTLEDIEVCRDRSRGLCLLDTSKGCQELVRSTAHKLDRVVFDVKSKRYHRNRE